ncbi:uncharacterized protein LOC127863717 isoform X3 [Dreissena polymorpha]|uniref:uncharacterized protein LOC127863717 isoform X3 n=1 Tax=Dreissena polymorpha TaxID=45954 RepID=UPI002263CAA2|nr:uncharacterized protein LOC127863717 isoform X3 [Dreissena polymorpha]
MAQTFRRQLSSERTKTKVWGPLTRELIKVFKEFCDSDQHLHEKNIRDACNALDLYPSTSQVHEMMVCAMDYGSPCKPDHFTFGEFCVLVAELKTYYQLNPKPPVPVSMVRIRAERNIDRKKRRVFLGGSCNPTKWRAEIAIPFFKENGITFYNPQVQNWKPELMELEAQAKQMADIMFFVIDSKTRAISSMIEVAYLVATQRQVVVTMCEYKSSNICVDSETLTDSYRLLRRCDSIPPQCEMLDLVKGRLILTDLVERNGVPIFTDVRKALACTKTIVKQGCHVSELTLKDGAHPVKHGHLKLGRALLELREAFNSVDSEDLGWLSSEDVCFAYKTCTGEEMDSKWLKTHRKNQDDFDYEEFCSIVTEYRAEMSSPTILQRILTVILHPIQWITSKFSEPFATEEYTFDDEYHDVYLGGSDGDLLWRAEVAVPLFRKFGLSFVDPSSHDWDQKLIPIHVSLREKCRLLFYVISTDKRSLGSMCEAGYYIGKGCRMVLCVQKLEDNAVISDEQLSPCAIKDYNRGRQYLCDLASREGIPLFDDIQEAANCVVNILCDVQSATVHAHGIPRHGSQAWLHSGPLHPHVSHQSSMT